MASTLWALVLCLSVLFPPGMPSLAQGVGTMDRSFPEPGEWPCYRANGRLDAHARLRGQTTQPHIAWRQFVGAIDTWLTVAPGSGQTRISIPLKEITSGSALTSDPRWGLM